MNPDELDLKLDPEQQRIYDSVPALPSRSRLEPYRTLILRWRRQGRSYRNIRQLLAEKCSVHVANMTLHEFVQRHNRPRKPAEPELEPQTALTPQPVTAATPKSQPTFERKRLTPEEKAAQVAFLRALRDKPVIVPEVQKPRFEYDPDKPLTIDRTIKD